MDVATAVYWVEIAAAARVSRKAGPMVAASAASSAETKVAHSAVRMVDRVDVPRVVNLAEGTDACLALRLAETTADSRVVHSVQRLAEYSAEMMAEMMAEKTAERMVGLGA